MTRPYGDFCWYELITPDIAGARDFYSQVIGWTFNEIMGPDYTLLEAGGVGIGGMMTLNDEMKAMGVPPCWSGYVFVESLEGTIERLTTLGGSVRRPPMDIPNYGRFAVVADPQGAVFLLFQDTQNTSPPPIDEMTHGRCGWRELMAGDGEKAFEFYSTLFGWTKDMAVPMGEMGVYQTFASNGVRIGGMMSKPENIPGPPFWGYYFRTDGAEAAVERIKAAGGQVVMGPMQVPDGSWIVQGIDPQGAHFAVVAQKN